jgi:hypothetical protein
MTSLGLEPGTFRLVALIMLVTFDAVFKIFPTFMFFPVSQTQTLFQHSVLQYPESTNSGIEENK